MNENVHVFPFSELWILLLFITDGETLSKEKLEFVLKVFYTSAQSIGFVWCKKTSYLIIYQPDIKLLGAMLFLKVSNVFWYCFVCLCHIAAENFEYTLLVFHGSLWTIGSIHVLKYHRLVLN